MTTLRNARAIDDRLSGQLVSAANELRIEDPVDFQIVIGACSASLLREIGDFLDTQDTSHPFQLPQWDGGSGAHLALLRREGRLCWFAQGGVLYPAGRFLRPLRALTFTRGPVCDDLELMEVGLRQLMSEGRKRKFAYIDVAPEWTGAFAKSAAPVFARNGWEPLSDVRSSLRLDLRPALDRLFASFRKTTRYEIRRSESRGVNVTIAGAENDWHDFLKLYSEMASQRQFPAEDPDLLLGVLRWLAANRDRGGLFLAVEDGIARGGVVIIRSGGRCWYVSGATSKDSKWNVGHLLQWRAIQWAKENGCFEYDFGGFREDASTGPALFKRGFCDRIVHFIPPHRYIVSPVRNRTVEFISGMRRSLRRTRIS